MVKIRLRRMGRNKKPSYRVVVADSKSPRDGAFIQNLGYYNPLTNPPTVVLDAEKVTGWLSKGAKPTPTVQRLLSKAGITPLNKDTSKEKGASENG